MEVPPEHQAVRSTGVQEVEGQASQGLVHGDVQGFVQGLGPNTDFAIGAAGGGFADSYYELRGGEYIKGESFDGHGGELSASVYHLFNPADRIMDRSVPAGTGWLPCTGTGPIVGCPGFYIW